MSEAAAKQDLTLDGELATVIQNLGIQIVNSAEYDWAPRFGAPLAKAMLLDTALHLLMSGVAGLTTNSTPEQRRALWEMVKAAGDEILAETLDGKHPILHVVPLEE